MAQEKRKRHWGDRRDGRWGKDAPGMQTVMAHIYPNRADSEVFVNEPIDFTELLRYLEEKNKTIDYKITLFHCIVDIIARILRERPLMNRFVQGHRIYEHNEISLSFVVKRRFSDTAEESLMTLVPDDEDTINEISRRIVGDVKETRKSETSTGGIDAVLDTFAKIHRPLLMIIVRIVRWLDFWGLNPKAITDGDVNYSSVLLSNLGSIKCPAIYHHLNNYGTNSVLITIGTLHKEEIIMEDGHKEIRDIVNFGATIDERIGDGFYFARSLRLVKYMCAHPELLELPLNVPSGFDYNA